MLSDEETSVIEFLKPLGKQFVSAKEVARRAGGKQKFVKDPYWAKPVLKRLEKKGVLESNEQGQFRLRDEEEDKKKKKNVPVSPQIQRILSQSSKDFTETVILESDQDYEKLNKVKKERKPKKG